MDTYNYMKEMKSSIQAWIYLNKEYLENTDNREDFEQWLYDELWTVDEVTGNGSGSYWFSRYDAEKAICGNRDLLAEAMEEFCTPWDRLAEGPEFADVTIRCYLLGQAISEVLDEFEEEMEA